MASKAPKVNEFDLPESEDLDNIEPEAMSESSQALTLDQLDELGFDDERDQEELAKLNPPSGNWNKEDTFQFKMTHYDTDSQEGDISTSGRTIYSFSGKCEPREANGIEYQPVLFFRISPDIRYKQDKPTEVDHAYKLFLKAKELFLTLRERKATTQRELVEMLVEDSYVLRTMNGDSGPFVLDVLPKRKAKG